MSVENGSAAPAEVFPVSHFIREECAARGWDEAEFVRRFVNKFPDTRYISECIAEFVWHVDRPGLYLDLETERALSQVFGTDATFWGNIDRKWQAANVETN